MDRNIGIIETRLGSQMLPYLETFARFVIDGREPNEIIERHESTYIYRYMLARKSMIPIFVASRSRVPVVGATVDNPAPMPSELENIYLHYYLRSDAEDLHCHPWANGSIVIWGWLDEEGQDGVVRRLYPGDILIRPADAAHAIRAVHPGTITLFGTGPKVREWGFYPRGQFVHHSDYRKWKIDNGVSA